MINPATVVIRAESRPRDENREIKKETTNPMIPVLCVLNWSKMLENIKVPNNTYNHSTILCYTHQ